MSRIQATNKIQVGLSKRNPNLKTKLKFIANTWLNNTLDKNIRTQVIAGTPKLDDKLWHINIQANITNKPVVGNIIVEVGGDVIFCTKTNMIKKALKEYTTTKTQNSKHTKHTKLLLKNQKFYCNNSLECCKKLKNESIDLLLTDPPYGISNPYATEAQIPRRVRKSGGDFIMPKGEFGKWDHGFNPKSWTDIIIPKIKGWVVIFCSHIQIKEYSDILHNHGFVAIGSLAWHKTNPVPFNHKFKLLSAYESAVVGKRSGTKFNGKSVHNVFTYKSPSPQHRIHPTQKPLELMEELIELFTDKGDKILDPFAGSATTLMASMNKSRRCVAYENDPKYFELAVNRIRQTIMSFSE